jgi:hypothetical protein
VVLGALGKREPEAGPAVPLPDDEKGIVRRQAFGVLLRSIVVGAAATAIVWALGALLRGQQ